MDSRTIISLGIGFILFGFCSFLYFIATDQFVLAFLESIAISILAASTTYGILITR